MIVLGTDLVYRTVPLPRAQAERVAAMFTANARFSGATIEPARTVGLWFVAFTPANPERLTAMMERFQGERQERAQQAEETGSWVWADDDSMVATPHFDKKTGETDWKCYEVTDTTCTCPDFAYRASRIGLVCKHALAHQERAARRLTATVASLNETGALPGEEPGQFAAAAGDDWARANVAADFV